MKKIIITEEQFKKIVEQEKIDDGSYMVLQNLVSIKNSVETILSLKHKNNFSKLVTGEHAWAGDHISTSKDDIEEVANFISGQFNEESLDENKKMDKNPCWKNYEMVGTKIKNGKEVPNCVPKNKINEQETNNSLTESDLESLKNINNNISKQDVIMWFNDNDVEYDHMTDIEMYIVYIENLLKQNEDDFYGTVEETNYKITKTLNEAEYQGRKVTLNKPTRGDVKKFKVYVKNDKGNIVKVNFGDPNMRIKKNNPERRKSFRARHKCDNPGPKWMARYWACKSW